MAEYRAKKKKGLLPGPAALLGIVVARPALILVQTALGLVKRHSWLSWWTVGFAVAKYGENKRLQRRRRRELAEMLGNISGKDLQTILGALPSWVKYPEFEKAYWVNAIVKRAWYFIDKAVEGVLRDCLRDLLENPPIPLKYMGLSKLTLETLTLGGAPPTCGGVKVVNTEKEEVVVDVEAKLAGGEPNILLVAHTITGQRIPLQLAELQVFTTVRLGFTPLLPTFPCFGAVTISVMGQPFVDFSLKIVAGDLMTAPGLDLAVSKLIHDLIQLLVWPQRIVVPLFDETYVKIGSLMPKNEGVILVNIVRARGLPGSDLPAGSVHPYLKLKVSGQHQVVQTSQKGRAQDPEWNELFQLLVMDPATQTMEVELWDSSLVAVWDTSLVSGNKHVATATLRLEEVLCDEPFGRGLWKGWVKFLDLQSGFRSHLGRTLQGAADVPANILNTVSLGLIPSAGGGGGGGAGKDGGGAGGGQGAERRPSRPGAPPPSRAVGELFVEVLHVPFIPLEMEQPIDMAEVERLQRLVPAHWRLPRPGVLTVVLLRCTSLQAPDGFSKANPMVSLSLCNGPITLQTKTSSVGKMTFNPVYNETFEFVGLSNEMFDRLNIVVTNQPSDGALSTVSRVTERLGDELSQGLKAMGGAIAGGVLGHGGGSSSAIERQQQRDGFMGRKTLMLRDLAQRCVLARGAVAEQISLDEAKCGEVALTLEWRESVAALFDDPADASAGQGLRAAHRRLSSASADSFRRRGGASPVDAAEQLLASTPRAGGAGAFAPGGGAGAGGGGGGGGGGAGGGAQGGLPGAAGLQREGSGAQGADRRPPGHAAHRSASVREMGAEKGGWAAGNGGGTDPRGRVAKADVLRAAAGALGGMMDRRVSASGGGGGDQAGEAPGAERDGRGQPGDRDRDGHAQSAPRERAGPAAGHDGAAGPGAAAGGGGDRPPPPSASASASAAASTAASRAASGATSPVAGALDMQDAVDLIAELTSALHESEAERRDLAERHDAERRRRKALEAQVSVNVAQMLPLARPPAAGAFDGLIELGVSGVSAGVNTVTSGVNSVATGVTGVATGVAAALASAGASMNSMNRPSGFPSLLNPASGRRNGGGSGAGGDGVGAAGFDPHSAGAPPALSPRGAGLQAAGEPQQQWTKLPQQIELRSIQPTRAADSAFSAEKAQAPSRGDGGPGSARAPAVSMPRYEWDLGATDDGK